MSVGNRPWLCYIAGGYYIIVLYNFRSLGVDNCKSILVIIYTIHDTKLIIKYYRLELSIFILFISLCVIRFQHYSGPYFFLVAQRQGRRRVVANRCPSSFQWEALVPTLQRLASGCQSLWSPGDF